MHDVTQVIELLKTQASETKLRELESALMEASGGGRDPVVMDTSLCTYRFKRESQAPIQVFDIVDFIHDVRRDLGVPNLPVFIAKINDAWCERIGGGEVIRRANENSAVAGGASQEPVAGRLAAGRPDRRRFGRVRLVFALAGNQNWRLFTILRRQRPANGDGAADRRVIGWRVGRPGR